LTPTLLVVIHPLARRGERSDDGRRSSLAVSQARSIQKMFIGQLKGDAIKC
jgi:hypothetical protein